MDERERHFFSRHGNGDLRIREILPSRGLPPSSSRYRKRRDHSQKPSIDPNLVTQILFLINQNPRDLLQKLDELRDHISRSCEVSEKSRERPLQPASRRTLSASSFGHRQSHGSALPEVRSPGNHFSPRHLHSVHRHNLPVENGTRSFNERYRRVRVSRDPYAHYAMKSRENNAGGSNYGESYHRYEDNSYFAPPERFLLGSQDYDQRSIIKAPVYSPRVESFKRKAKQSYRPMNGASPFAICDSCFALLQLPSGFVFNRHRRNPQLKCGSCSAVIGLKFTTGKHKSSENHSIGSYSNWNYGSSSNFSQEKVYSKDIKPISRSTSQDFDEREYGYDSREIKTPKQDLNERYFHEVSFGTYEAIHVSVNEAGDVSENEVMEGTRDRKIIEELEDLEGDETKSCVEDVKKTVEVERLADATPSGENRGVTLVNEKMEMMKAQVDRSIEPNEVKVKDTFETSTDHAEETSIDKALKDDFETSTEHAEETSIDKALKDDFETSTDHAEEPSIDKALKDDFEASTEHAEENSIDKALNEHIQKMEEKERSVDDIPVEVKKNSTETVVLKESTENKEEMETIGDSDTYEVDSVNSHSINSSSYRESSRGSFEARLDEEPSVAGKNGDSFFGGLVKRSFKFNRSTERSKCKVWVNGRPISERAVKRAEKKAGPVDPGDYWYDYRAGFWGVMGHHCLGIIPPFIKEFNYPMPQNCAGGTTGVLVNGRELHQKDLALLVGRGLPSVSGRSYMIEMSGKVVDEATGRELRNLGKLAPTIEILKRGFGMLIPPDIN